jgi:hypothetical protein
MLGEFDLIDRYFRDAAARRDDVLLGVGDDGALLRPKAGFDLVMVERLAALDWSSCTRRESFGSRGDGCHARLGAARADAARHG